MSYFFAGNGIEEGLLAKLIASFEDVIPEEIRIKSFQIKRKNACLLAYGYEKVIDDVFIQSETSDSWLAILGTPLLRLSAREDRQQLVEKLFQNPKEFCRQVIDGCFALISYNALLDRFLLASDFNNTTPVYYAPTAKGYLFSSHELPLAKAIQADVDPLGFSMTINTGLSWGSRTRFKAIRKTLPCQILTFSREKPLSSEFFWTSQEETQWPSGFKEVEERWLDLLRNSVSSFYAASKNRTVICEITAGEDTRLLLSEVHACGIPFLGMVDGSDCDLDVKVATEISEKAGFELFVRAKPAISEDQLLSNAVKMSLKTDAYQDYFETCGSFATDSANPPRYYEYVKFCGAPGGEAFRGSYYLRGKALVPSQMKELDHRFFVKMKFMLDHYPTLLRFPDDELIDTILSDVEKALVEVQKFPIGTKIDHLLRVFQTCNSGLIYKNPRYIPFASRDMTRSIYDIPPKYKSGGKLTKACTELLFPEIANIKTQKGVPTIKKTPARFFLFMPEYLATAKLIARGARRRLLKWGESNKPGYQWSKNERSIMTLLKVPPYRSWFSSAKAMVTGDLYNQEIINFLFKEAKEGRSRYVPTLGRIISQELSFRWVRGEDFPEESERSVQRRS